MTPDLPWDDCKVAFGVDHDDWAEPTNWLEGSLPKGWSLVELDGAGARLVAVFRVEGPLRPDDGVEVRLLLDDMCRA